MTIAPSTPRLIAEKRGSVGWLIFNNPERHNAVSMDMWEGVPDIIAHFQDDAEIRTVVLTGAGDKAFVAGADISQFEETRSDLERSKIYEVKTAAAFNAIAQCEKPTIAMIRGYCIGGGLGIAASCDLRIAAEGASFAIPAARLGLAYAAEGTRRLVEIVGPAYAKEIFFTARRFTDQEASRMGLVNRVVPTADLEASVAEICEIIGENAPLTVATAKKTVDSYSLEADERAYAEVETWIARCFASDDYAEGRTAFMEKRKPVFKGK